MKIEYKVLTKQIFKLNDYQLSPISESSIEKIRIWRNEQMVVLRQKEEICPEDQVKYYRNVILPNFSDPRPKIILFELHHHKELIGYGGFVHISWEDKRAEISFLLSSALSKEIKVYQAHFFNYLEMIKSIGFNELKFNKLFTETYDIRPHHISTLEKAGFKLEGILRNHVLIEGNYINSLMHGMLISSDV